MKDHGLAIAAELDVKFHCVRTGFDRRLDRLQGILRIAVAVPTVGDK